MTWMSKPDSRNVSDWPDVIITPFSKLKGKEKVPWGLGLMLSGIFFTITVIKYNVDRFMSYVMGTGK